MRAGTNRNRDSELALAGARSAGKTSSVSVTPLTDKPLSVLMCAESHTPASRGLALAPSAVRVRLRSLPFTRGRGTRETVFSPYDGRGMDEDFASGVNGAASWRHRLDLSSPLSMRSGKQGRLDMARFEPHPLPALRDNLGSLSQMCARSWRPNFEPLEGAGS